MQISGLFMKKGWFIEFTWFSLLNFVSSIDCLKIIFDEQHNFDNLPIIMNPVFL